MAEFVNNAETEYFLAEYGSCYLGCGRAVWSLAPRMRELQRDPWSKLREKSITALDWNIELTLPESEKFWDFFCSADTVSRSTFSEKMFTSGEELKLFPAASAQSGFLFRRCYLDKISRIIGNDNGLLVLKFSCECDLSDNSYMVRTYANSLPEGAVELQPIDIALLRRKLLDWFGFKLNLVPGQNINLNFFAPDCNISAMLKLTECKNWQVNSPREFDFTLQCRSLVGDISTLEQKLYSAALQLNSNAWEFDGVAARSAKVRSLVFGELKTVNGMQMLEHTLKFALSMQ